MRERSRSRAFRASLVVMVLGLVAVIVVPSLLDKGDEAKTVGLAGTYAAELPATVQAQSGAVGPTASVRTYPTIAAGEEAVRDGNVDVLVVDARKLEWQRRTDEQLEAVVAGSIQLVELRKRAQAAGIDPDALLAMVAPVRLQNVELGQVEGRTPDDETAAFLMTIVLFMAISTYGALVLTGVVEEKSSRVVEVLLARIPARSLLAGKVAGIGLLGLAQIGVTAIAAVIAMATVDSFDVPAARGAVIAWAVVWFVLGYALYAMTYGALGSLASRTEDAQSAAGPVMVILFIGYIASFATIGSPDEAWAKAVSFFPPTAPFAMPNRVAMGATAWWEPVVAAALTVVTIAALAVLGGRVYSRAVLHTGAALKLRDVWRDRATAPPAREVGPREERRRLVTLAVVAVGLFVAVATVANDVILGVAVGAGFFAVGSRVVKAHRPVIH
jgi:ABC-2 type transport system permease protein